MAEVRTNNYDINNVYKDLDLSMSVHPLTGNYKTVNGINAVKRSIRHLMLSAKWDFPFNGDVYGGITESLFEQLSPTYLASLEARMRDVLSKYERRIEVQDITFEVQENSGNLFITIKYRIIAVEQVFETRITLSRER